MEVLHSSYTMGTRGSPNIYTLGPQACGPQASGVYIRQTTCAHGITIKCAITFLNIQNTTECQLSFVFLCFESCYTAAHEG